MISANESTGVNCKCNHLPNFAILVVSIHNILFGMVKFMHLAEIIRSKIAAGSLSAE